MRTPSMDNFSLLNWGGGGGNVLFAVHTVSLGGVTRLAAKFVWLCKVLVNNSISVNIYDIRRGTT